MSSQSDVVTLKKKIEDASNEVKGTSKYGTSTILESLSDDIRRSIAKTSIECYDTLLELDYLCEEAELHIRLDYSSALKELATLYENETT
jgi:hypothetical protein